MPTPSELLVNMHYIANDAIAIALLWHVALGVALVAFWRGWRPSRRVAGMLLAAPVLSVAVVAFVYGNPFNTLVFGGLASALVVIARRMDGPLSRGANWEIAAGHFFIGIGIFYPHFLEQPLAYLVAAPFGLLPCPTLAALVGFTLVSGGFSKVWNLTLVFFTVFYGVVGVVQLGVWLDLVLVLGALTLTAVAAYLMERVAEPRRTTALGAR